MASSAATDGKQGERDYFARIGAEGRHHAARKPFGDDECVRYLMNATVLMSVMPPPPARVIEFGCGTGWLSLWLGERGYAVTGLDISPEAIEIARDLASQRGLRKVFFETHDYEHAHAGALADCVVFHDALHHAESPLAALRAAHAALRVGGVVACIEPGDGHAASPASRRAVEDFGVHENDMPPRTILRHARAAGFRRHVVLPWPWFFVRSTYRPAYHAARSQADLHGRKWLSLVRLIRAFFNTRAQGCVLLWKE